MMKVLPKVSVILPYYNAEETLDRAISSICMQEFEDFECILVDNRSTDGGEGIAKEWAQKDRRFIVITEEKKGVMFASNRGAEIARGEYLARMDADDRSYPNRLKLQSDFLDAYPDYGAVAGLVKHVGDPVTTEGFRRFVDWSNSLRCYEEIYYRRFIESPIVNPSSMWRRSAMEQHGLYRSGDFPEDYEMWLRWLDKGVKIAKVPQIVLDWHDSEKRLTRTNSIYSDRAFYEVKSRYLAKWLSEHNPFHPYVHVWGASRISRRRVRILEKHGIKVKTYIDTRRGRQLDHEVIYYMDLPRSGERFILTYIRQMDNREKIQRFLEKRGYAEGVNYLLVS